MGMWKNDVLGFIPQADWLNVGFSVARPNDPIDGLFGDDKTDNIMAYWQSIASEYQIPVMAQFHGFDTEAQKTFRIPVDTHNIEKGLIKVKLNQSERLRELQKAGVQGDENIYRYVMQDGLRLAEQVVTRSKVAKNEVLATGKMTIKENDLDLTVDYGVPQANLGKSLDLGDGATTDAPTQLQSIIDDATDEGVKLTKMVMSSKVLTKLRKNTAIQKAINGAMGAGQLVKRADLNAYLSEEYGINEIVVNDQTYGVPNGHDASGRPKIIAKRYFPENKVSFVALNASGNVGIGLWGNPPELDAAYAFRNVSGSAPSPYVFVSQWAENDPAVIWTKASALFIPVLYNPNSLFVASVTETPGA